MFKFYNGDEDQTVRFNYQTIKRILNKTNPSFETKHGFPDMQVGEYTIAFSYFVERRRGIDFLRCHDKVYVQDSLVSTEEFSKSYPRLSNQIRAKFPTFGFNVIFVKELNLRMQVCSGRIHNIIKFKEVYY